MNHDMSMLPMLFSALQKKMMEQHQKIMDKYQISKSHMPYIMMLKSNKEGMTQHELTEKSFLDKALTSRSLRELLEKGYVEKENTSKYKNKFRITEKGSQVARAFKIEGAKVHKKVLEALSDEEIEQLGKIVSKIYEAFE
ncbi:MAG: MarR family transcriptional regulator [Acholeplasmataceae bacterium]|nr:MarR family transcriptional regulator [Acholeplasmataceae bacterium]